MSMPLRSIGLVLLTVLITGCGRKERPMTAAPMPVGIENSEALWHLRAGLNVAALTCRGRGRPAVAPLYSRVIARHRVIMAQAYAAEQRRHGSGFDRHQTRIYNRFAAQRLPTEFCRRAVSVARQAAEMASPALARSAGPMLAALD